jgi:hypothetical protein
MQEEKVMRWSFIASAAVAGASMLPPCAFAAIDVIFTEIPGHPTAVVPTGPGFAGVADFELFDRPFRSPDGQRWILQAQKTGDDTEDRIVIVFDGSSASTVLGEGQQAPWTANAETMGFFVSQMGINDLGQFAFGNDTQGGPDTSDDYVLRFGGKDYDIIAQEGQSIAALPGSNYGASQDGIHILNNGTVAFWSTTSASGQTLFLGSNVVARVGVDAPTNQIGGGTETYQSFTGGSYAHSSDGSEWMVRADLNGDTAVDIVMVVSGAVVLQEGTIIPGSRFASPIATGFTNSFALMMSSGDWFVRGSNADDIDWIVRNGSVIATSGEPITPASAELFDDTIAPATFFFQQGNNDGDWVIGGATDASDPNADWVFVFNGTQVVAREGDMVDLNGNGQADDNAFLSDFTGQNDDGFLTDDDVLHFTANLRDGAGADLGQAFLSIELGGATCLGDTNNSGAVDVDDLVAVILGWGACANCPPAVCSSDIDGDCDTDVDDLVAVILNWGACP